MSSPSAAVLANSNVLLNIFGGGSSIDALLALAAVSKSVRRSAREVQRHLFCPGRFLHMLFPNQTVPDFLLTCRDVVVTGAPVLRYMADFTICSRGLVFAVLRTMLPELLSFLSDAGYVVKAVDRFASSAARYNPIDETYLLRRDGDSASIWVHVARCSLLHVVLSQRTTCFFNAISDSHFFALFPRSSLLDRRGLVLALSSAPSASRDRFAIPGGNPYALERLGYGLDSLPVQQTHPSLRPGLRSFGDKWTWTTRLDGDTSAFGFYRQSWNLGQRQRINASTGLGELAFVIESTVLDAPAIPRPFLIAPEYLRRVVIVLLASLAVPPAGATYDEIMRAVSFAIGH